MFGVGELVIATVTAQGLTEGDYYGIEKISRDGSTYTVARVDLESQTRSEDHIEVTDAPTLFTCS